MELILKNTIKGLIPFIDWNYENQAIEPDDLKNIKKITIEFNGDKEVIRLELFEGCFIKKQRVFIGVRDLMHPDKKIIFRLEEE